MRDTGAGHHWCEAYLLPYATIIKIEGGIQRVDYDHLEGIRVLTTYTVNYIHPISAGLRYSYGWSGFHGTPEITHTIDSGSNHSTFTGTQGGIREVDFQIVHCYINRSARLTVTIYCPGPVTVIVCVVAVVFHR